MTDLQPRTDLHAYKEVTVEEAIQGIKPYHKESYLRDLYYLYGMTQQQIAEFYGVDTSTICYWFDKHGIPTRPAVDDDEYIAGRGDV